MSQGHLGISRSDRGRDRGHHLKRRGRMDRIDGRSTRHLVNELARVEEGIRRTRGMMGETQAEQDEGLRSLIDHRDELVRLLGIRQASAEATEQRLSV